MLVVYSPGPITGKCVFQWFGFTNALKRVSFCFFYEGVDAAENFFTPTWRYT